MEVVDRTKGRRPDRQPLTTSVIPRHTNLHAENDAMIDGPDIEVADAMLLVGIHRPMRFTEPKMRELWQEFRPRVKEVKGRASNSFISMRVYDHPVGAAPSPGSSFEQWAAVEVDAPVEVPDRMDVHRLTGGLYAVFTYRGPADAFGDAGRYIYRDWLPGSEFQLADREFFEVLGPSYRPDDPEASEAIWIPIQERGRTGSQTGA